jgi:pimeloyl-ACP methyl ester carboxylesterase
LKKFGALIVALGIVGSVSPADAYRPAIVDVPVVFAVRNVNTSQVPCSSDGVTYQIRGHLVSPERIPSSVTLWLHGGGAGEWQWHFTSVPGYDFATEMARLGHASVVIDRLGFDSSGHPDGMQVCVGSEADVVHQVIEKLRTGNYTAGRVNGVRFGLVALGGNSFGATVAESEAVSFHDADALIVNGWAEHPIYGATQVYEVVPQSGSTCARGGEPAEAGDETPSGYTYVWPSWEAEAEDIFYNAAPEVVNAFGRLRNRDACGLIQSVATADLVHQALLGTVTSPVLLVYGDHDLVTPTEADVQRARYGGSSDVSLAIIPNTGHVGMIERTAPTFRAVISGWLAARGF